MSHNSLINMADLPVFADFKKEYKKYYKPVQIC